MFTECMRDLECIKGVNMEEYPDHWEILKIQHDDKVIYKVFATWHGSYLGEESWQLNSGIVSAVLEDECYVFTGVSGSKYYCRLIGRGVNSMYGSSQIKYYIESAKKAGATIDIVDHSIDPTSINYEF